jgi:hypothetical protein
MQPEDNNPMNHPQEPNAGIDDAPRFGRLLIVLLLAVAFIGLLTFAGEAYFS